MAHFLLHCTAPQEALMLEDQQSERLDQSLALALKHLSLSPHRTTSGPPTHTHADTHTAEARVQQLCSLLHLASRHGLRAVASFVLQQPGGRDALRRPSTRGETVAREAERRGHEQLLQLLRRYETSSHVEEEPEEQVLSYPEGRVFRRHANLGTYTLTVQREEGAEPESREHLQDEVEELRRLIHLHRDTKGTSGVCGHRAETCTAPSGGGLQACTNGQDAGPAAVTIETCSTTEEQGSPLSLEERTQGAEPAAFTQTSCSSGLSICKKQEAGGEVSGSAGRARKNKKKSCKRMSREEKKRSAQRNTDTTIQDTPLPIKPDGKCAPSYAVAVPTTTVVEKQEVEKWEVEQLMCERSVETESVTEQRHTQSRDLRSAVQPTETMGQEQSQGPQESQSDPEGPSPPDKKTSPSPKSPEVERKPRRVLWRDGGWMSSRMGSETKTLWYEGEGGDLQQGGEGGVNSQSVWYDGDTMDTSGQEEPKQREQEAESPSAAQPHAAGPQPAPSHGPSAAQRQEVHAPQREEEAGPECRRERGASESRKSSETADNNNEEREPKSRRKRRKKRGRRGSSGSSIESHRGPEADLNPEQEDQTGTVPEATTREEAEQDAMTLPGQTEGRSSVSSPEVAVTDERGTDQTRGTPVHTGDTQDVDCEPDHSTSSCDAAAERPDITMTDGEGNTADGEESRGHVDLDLQTEEDLSVQASLFTDAPPSTDDSSEVEFPELKTQRVPPLDSDRVGQPVDQGAGLPGFMDSEHPAGTGGPPCEGTADVSLLLTGEGSAETAPREHSGHCLTSETMRDQQQEMCVGEEGVGKERRRRSEEGDIRMVHGEEKSSSDRDTEHKHNEEELAAAAVAVIAVAVASALASIELSRQLANNESEGEESAGTERSEQEVLTDADRSLQLTSNEHRHVLASSTAEAGNTLKEQANEEQLACDTEEQLAEHLHSNQQAVDTSAFTQLVTEGNQTRPEGADSMLKADLKPSRRVTDEVTAEVTDEVTHKVTDEVTEEVTDEVTDEVTEEVTAEVTEEVTDEVTDKVTAEVTEEVTDEVTDEVTHEVTHKVTHKVTDEVTDEVDTQTESELLSPVRDTEQHPEGSREQPVCLSEAGGETGLQVQEGERRDVSQVRESEAPQLDEQVQGPSDPPCDSAPEADPHHEEPPVDVDLSEQQLSRSLSDLTRAPVGGDGEDRDANADMDTVDGWKERERAKKERGEEARRDEVTEEDTSETETESCEPSSQEKDSTHIQQVSLKPPGPELYTHTSLHAQESSL
nr:A-kinase anchor protein 13-like isoform X2 [Labrus bergylta]